MDVTTLSTKGQVVIPESLRRDFEVGTSFSVAKINNLIVLRPITGLTKDEEKELKELSKIWVEIDSGKVQSYSQKDFFAKMKQW